MDKKLVLGVVVIATILFSFIMDSFKEELVEDGDDVKFFWESDGIVLMENVNTGVVGCFGCNDVLCVDPLAEVMNEIEESEERYCGEEFEVVGG